MRFALACVTALILSASPASAGDGSALQVLGFSPNGKRFAFEQRGSHDGSGNAFSAITVIGDGGGEVEREIAEPATQEEAERALSEKIPRDEAVRGAVREAATLLFALDGGTASPATLLAEHADAKASEDLLPMDVHPVRERARQDLAFSHPALGGAANLRLAEQPESTKTCEPMTSEAVTATLTLETADGRKTLIFEGPGNPRARMCPTRLGLVAAYLHDKPGARALAIVLQEFPIGFEGPDRRFFAVRHSLPE